MTLILPSEKGIIMMLVVIATVIGTLLLFSQPDLYPNFDYKVLIMAQTDSAETPLSSSSFALSNLVEQGSPYIGNLSAPISIVDFSDFQCPNCGRHVKNTEPILNEKYVQTGKASLVYKYFPVVGFDSMNPALAGQCSHEQGKFWQFHQLLFANQKPIDSGWVSKDNLKNFASQIRGLVLQKFSDFLDSERYINLIN